MKVSVNGVSTHTFFSRLFNMRIYCKTGSNWFSRLFERPLQINLIPSPVKVNYYLELNGLELGSAEAFDDGIIFNLYTRSDMYPDCQHFLSASMRHSYTLSIYNSNHVLVCDYNSATGTGTHLGEPPFDAPENTRHYKKVKFNWGHKSGGRTQMIRNPLSDLQAELERSQTNLRRALEQNASLLKVGHEKMEYSFPLDTPASSPENSASLPPTRDIKICKE